MSNELADVHEIFGDLRSIVSALRRQPFLEDVRRWHGNTYRDRRIERAVRLRSDLQPLCVVRQDVEIRVTVYHEARLAVDRYGDIRSVCAGKDVEIDDAAADGMDEIRQYSFVIPIGLVKMKPDAQR